MHRHLPEGLCLATVQSGAETGGFHGVSVLVRLLVPASPSRSDPGRLRQKARSRTARELGPTAMNLVAKLTLILFLSPQGERLAAGDRLLACPTLQQKIRAQRLPM